MSLSRYAKKRDVSEPDIVQALRSAGARVWQLDRPFDLLVGLRGRFVVLEVKTGKARTTDAQATELDACQAGGLPVFVVRTPEDAIQAVTDGAGL
jgi:predicted amidohydrolase